MNTLAAVTLLPQVNSPLRIPHFPLLEVSVNPLPLVVAVAVSFPGVWVLQVPYESKPPVLVPDTRTEMVPDEGTPVAVLSTDVVVVVVVPSPPPDFGRYLIPLDGQLPGVIASVLTKEPSMMDPFTYRISDQQSTKSGQNRLCVCARGGSTLTL